MTSLTDITSYNTNMRKSLPDKLWWLNKLSPEINTVVDYGCADGALLEAISISNPGAVLFGYDFSPDMVKLASENLSGKAKITDDYKKILCRAKPDTAVLSVSSVFHEIMNYSPKPEEDFERIFESGFRYIAIRDMFVSEKAFYPSDEKSVNSVLSTFPAEKIADFEKYIGSLRENQNLLQFFLTYRYAINWEREVRENYFPYTIEEFLSMIPKSYEILYLEHFILPFASDSVRQDFGVTVKDNTHGKILLRKKYFSGEKICRK